MDWKKDLNESEYFLDKHRYPQWSIYVINLADFARFISGFYQKVYRFWMVHSRLVCFLLCTSSLSLKHLKIYRLMYCWSWRKIFIFLVLICLTIFHPQSQNNRNINDRIWNHKPSSFFFTEPLVRKPPDLGFSGKR